MISRVLFLFPPQLKIATRLDLIRTAAQGGGDTKADPAVKQAISEVVNLRYRLQIARERLMSGSGSGRKNAQYGGIEVVKAGHQFHPVETEMKMPPDTCDMCEKQLKPKLVNNPLKAHVHRRVSLFVCLRRCPHCVALCVSF